MLEDAFVGRERELAELNQFLARAISGHGQVVFVAGEVGSGKTSLIAEFARQAQDAHADLLVVAGSCNAQTGISDPYLPFREVLALLTGDVDANVSHAAVTDEARVRLRGLLVRSAQVLIEVGPDLVDVLVPGAKLVGLVGKAVANVAGVPDDLEQLVEQRRARLAAGQLPVEQSHIFEQYTAVLQRLAEEQPIAILLDDLHWVDLSSLSLLFHLGRRITDSRILIVGTYRPEDVALGRHGERHPLDRVLNEFKRYFGDVEVDLRGASDTERRRFIDELLDTEPNRLGSAFREALFRHTDGQALFTVELLREMQARGYIVQDEAGRWIEAPQLDWGVLPERVEGVVEERIGRLEDELREILTVASVEGEDFTAQVVARVQDASVRHLLRQLSRDLERRHHLVRECGEIVIDTHRLSRYQFAHTPCQRYLYGQLSAAERRLFHADVARILEELYAGKLDEITVQLARHYEEAGVPDKAVKYLLDAGDHARALYAHAEAVTYYEKALAILEEQGERERAARVLMKLGLTHHMAFDFQSARQVYERGFAAWRQASVSASTNHRAVPYTLRVGILQTPAGVDPALAADGATAAVQDQIFSGLVDLNSELDIVPDVAHSWDVLEAGRKYVFRLRDDVFWSDGTPVTAGDFEFAWKRVLDPATGSPSASVLYDLAGAEAFNRGELTDPQAVGVLAVDPTTLVVELERPTHYFPYVLDHCVAYAVPRHIVERLGAAWAAVESMRPEELVTSGPLRVERWADDGLSFVRYHSYHGEVTGNVERVEVVLHDNPEERLQDYAADEVDIIFLWGLRPEELDRARRLYASEYVSGPLLHTSFIAFDTRQTPLQDRRVRQALAMGFDRRELADSVLRGLETPATGGFVPPGVFGHSTGIGLPYDVERAQQLMAEAGYRGGSGFPGISLLVPAEAMVPESEYIQASWRHNLGIEVNLDIQPWREYVGRLEERPAAAMYGWSADYPDPDNFLRLGIQSDATGWREGAFQRLVEEARRLEYHKDRMDLYNLADRLLMRDAAIVPLTYGQLHMLVKPRVRKFPMSAVMRWFWKDAVMGAG